MSEPRQLARNRDGEDLHKGEPDDTGIHEADKITDAMLTNYTDHARSSFRVRGPRRFQNILLPMSYTPTPTVTDLRILSPELRDLIKAFPLTVETAQTADAVISFMRAIPPRPHEDARVKKRDIHVSVSEDPSQPPTTVRLYVPDTDGKTPLPVLLWMHHGGFFSAGPTRLDPFLSTIALEASIVVAAPSFRQTPEHPFPAPFEDTYQVLLWLSSSTEVAEYGIDSARIAVGGTSAGGTLAVGACLRFRDERRRPSIRLLILDDASFTDRSTSYSTKNNPINRIWNANVTRHMWKLYLPKGSTALDDRTRGYAVPAHAQDLRGLPSTLVACAQWDDLTNDGVEFAHRLLESGVPTEIHTYRGTFHISDKLVHDGKQSKKKRRDIVEALDAAFE